MLSNIWIHVKCMSPTVKRTCHNLCPWYKGLVKVEHKRWQVFHLQKSVDMQVQANVTQCWILYFSFFWEFPPSFLGLDMLEAPLT
jgi:hypothetical protein